MADRKADVDDPRSDAALDAAGPSHAVEVSDASDVADAMAEAANEEADADPDEDGGIEGFDPATDPARGATSGIVKSAYQKLRRRGEDDRAESLRRLAPTSRQLQRAKTIRDFDPVHDQPNNRDRTTVMTVYDALVEAGHDDAAEELRNVDALQRQVETARNLDTEYFEGGVLRRSDGDPRADSGGDQNG